MFKISTFYTKAMELLVDVHTKYEFIMAAYFYKSLYQSAQLFSYIRKSAKQQPEHIFFWYAIIRIWFFCG